MGCHAHALHGDTTMNALALLHFRIVPVRIMVVRSCDVFKRTATTRISEVQVLGYGPVLFCKCSFLIPALTTRVHTAGIVDTC